MRRQREGKNTILENKTDELEGLQDFFNQKNIEVNQGFNHSFTFNNVVFDMKNLIFTQMIPILLLKVMKY